MSAESDEAETDSKGDGSTAVNLSAADEKLLHDQAFGVLQKISNPWIQGFFDGSKPEFSRDPAHAGNLLAHYQGTGDQDVTRSATFRFADKKLQLEPSVVLVTSKAAHANDENKMPSMYTFRFNDRGELTQLYESDVNPYGSCDLCVATLASAVTFVLEVGVATGGAATIAAGCTAAIATATAAMPAVSLFWGTQMVNACIWLGHSVVVWGVNFVANLPVEVLSKQICHRVTPFCSAADMVSCTASAKLWSQANDTHYYAPAVNTQKTVGDQSFPLYVSGVDRGKGTQAAWGAPVPMKRVHDAASIVQPVTGGELRWLSDDRRLEVTRTSEENAVSNPTGGRSGDATFFLRHQAADQGQNQGGVPVNAIPLHCL